MRHRRAFLLVTAVVAVSAALARWHAFDVRIGRLGADAPAVADAQPAAPLAAGANVSGDARAALDTPAIDAGPTHTAATLTTGPGVPAELAALSPSAVMGWLNAAEPAAIADPAATAQWLAGDYARAHPELDAADWGWSLYRAFPARLDCVDCIGPILAYIEAGTPGGARAPGGLPDRLVPTASPALAYAIARTLATGARDRTAEAVIWYERALDGDIAGAAVNLGEIAFRGTGGTRDLTAARDLFERAMRLGAPTAARRLADVLSFAADGTPPLNAPRALALYRDAAAAGDPAASYRLATMLEDASVVSDAAEIVAAYEQALDGGIPDAAVKLGDLAFSGTLGTRDLAQAKLWYERAQALGHSAAARRIADVLSAPDAPAPDIAGAIRLYREAAQGGDPASAYRLALLLQRQAEGGAPVAMDEVIRAYAQALDGGVHGAAMRLGYLYATGRLIPPDLGMARTYYRRAAELGVPDAAQRLEELDRAG